MKHSVSEFGFSFSKLLTGFNVHFAALQDGHFRKNNECDRRAWNKMI
ncbi:MAG: hypothetical protein V1775_06555 [Bacteroidota bacterium]